MDSISYQRKKKKFTDLMVKHFPVLLWNYVISSIYIPTKKHIHDHLYNNVPTYVINIVTNIVKKKKIFLK